jgi:hypothetical protein
MKIITLVTNCTFEFKNTASTTGTDSWQTWWTLWIDMFFT